MIEPAPPRLKKFPAARQRRMDELLEKNNAGRITAAEKKRLETLVNEAEELMVRNGKLLAEFARKQADDTPSGAVPVTVWVKPERAQA
jgi:hypothetical protein